MKSTGVVRKIDDLGRIVIPKEIRKSLGIRDGENLEISVEDNKIKLTKKNIINNYTDYINKLCLAVSDIISGTLIVTDREKITNISGSGIKISVGAKLSSDLKNMIDNRKVFNETTLNKFIFDNYELVGYYTIYPIIDDGNSLGLVILYNPSKSNHDYEMLIKFLANMLSRKLDIS